ncbi:MAG: hypothetical protein HYR70_01415 [Chloroflexi bacterium]|nr:hypothetical protein [Chloroflexota bacterium]MBI3341220.1 hypothetical protein [Chloroflexota bacterium]
MNRKTIFILLALFLLPIILRFAWYFPGFYLPQKIETPDYANLKMPQAPVSTPQPEEIKQTGGIVFADYSHANQFQPGEIQTLSDALARRGASLELNTDSTTLESQLKRASAYVIISPSIGFTADETRIILDFERRGGRLAVFTDATRGLIYSDSFSGTTANFPDSNIVNPLLKSFDISFDNDYLYNLTDNEGNFRNVFFEQFGKSDLTWGLKKVVLYGARSVKTDSGLGLLVGGDKTFSSQTDAAPNNDSKQGWAASALSADGNVLAVGDFTFMQTPFNTVADNNILVNNIADFLLSGRRKIALSDFPYVFNGSTASLLMTANVQMTAEMTGALSRLQSKLNTLSIDMQVSQSAPESGNLVVLGTFSPSEDLTKYIESYNLTLDDASEFIEIPQFGKLGRAGNGLVLFKAGQNGTTLVLLADTTDDLVVLMDTLSGGSLSGCVIQNDIAICSIGFGGKFSTGETPTPDGTPTPAAGAG